ncbi:MAG: hypothetical protein K2H87_06495 [Duncaniella sp.]|nr:hypothetical protein [Duncaniella sp.]
MVDNPKVRESLLDRYARLCLRMVCVCLIAMVIAAETYTIEPPYAVFLEIYFVVMLGFQLWSYHKARGIRLGEMSVCEAIRSVRYLERLRVIKRLTGLVLGVPLIIYMLVYIGNLFGASYMSVCIGGAVIGGVMGWFINRHATGLLTSLREELGDKDEAKGD